MSIIDNLKTTQEEYTILSNEYKNNLLIDGHPINYWKERYKIDIPIDVNTQFSIQIDSKLISFYQELSFKKNDVLAMLKHLNAQYKKEYNNKFAALYFQYKGSKEKLPAKDTIAAVVEEQLDNIKTNISHAEIELDFWDNLIKDLDRIRKTIENITLNVSVEAKMLRGNNQLDNSINSLYTNNNDTD